MHTESTAAEGFEPAGRRLERTSTPGIFKRGSRYVVIYRDPSGRQRKQAARTLAEARDVKAALRADVARGEYRALSRVTFAEYAPRWIDTYAGRTARGFRETTRDEYRRDLERDAIPYFGRMRLAEVEPRHVKSYAAHLAERGPVCRSCGGRGDEKQRTCRKCDGKGRTDGKLSPASVRLGIAPVRALFATAVEEGLIRSNPAAGLRVAQRVEVETADEVETRVKALDEDELRRLLDEVGDEWRPFFAFLAHTGLRIGEAVALRWSDIDFGRKRVKVRRRLYRGNYAPPKSRYGRRDVPLSDGMARALWQRRKDEKPADDAPLFPSSTGNPLDPSNVFARVLKPAARRAGVPWAGFHTLRHTCATMLFRQGLNAKMVQVWLGHHSPAFTLATYVHLLPDDLPAAGFLDALTAPKRGNKGATRAAENGRDAAAVESAG
ncbi:MAG TPA: tyrosine-type recombinase/integrase [Gaiellaceae bacterium]|nr:tyrosine-type recombinase/integrase [Gaiellaceae bacterium]